MTRSYNQWFISLVALLPVMGTVPVDCQHTEDYRSMFVLAIKNNGSGLEIFALFPENSGSVNSSKASQWPNHELEPQMLFIPGHNLSSECGDQYFRCQQLLVINESMFAQNTERTFGGSLNIVFVPLENGVLLLSLWYDSNNNIMRSTFIVNNFNCTPTVLYHINGKIYVVCIRSYEEYINIAVYELHVRLNISDSVVEFNGSNQLTNINISTSNSSQFSTFIAVDHRIYFAVGNTIIVMDIFDTTQTQQYPDLPQCTQIHKLVPIIDAENQQMLIAYCTDRYSYFGLEYGDWRSTQLFSSSGVPYICPDSSYKVRFFQGGILQFSVRDSSLNMINNVIIGSGICFESQNRTYFAYSSQQHNNVYVYDFITQNHYPVSPYNCTHQDCLQLLLLDDQYLIIQDADHNLVLDTTTNFSLIINISSGIADILTVLHSNVYSPITPSPPINLTTSTAEAPFSTKILVTSMLISPPNYTYTTGITLSPSVTVYSSIIVTTISPDAHVPNSNLVGIILTVIIGLFAIIMILVTVAVGFSIQRCRRSKWCKCNVHRIPRVYRRMRFLANQSPPVPLLVADNAQEEEEEESENYEMESVMNLGEPQRFGKGWRLTTTL